MALLARVADRLYWGARYAERAEDTARILRAYTDLLVDLPSHQLDDWHPLVALCGSLEDLGDDLGEEAVNRFLIADRDNPGSIVSSTLTARANLRTSREVLPREAWQALNGLSQYVESEAERAVSRRNRDRFLTRVVDDSRRLEGILNSTMTRDQPFRMWKLGRVVERADMTSRVIGVRAASLLRAEPTVDDYDEVQWMGVLRSVSALQMYQRATRAPIDGSAVVRFLLFDDRFPRAVHFCFDQIGELLAQLPAAPEVDEALASAASTLSSCMPRAHDGAQLDGAMDAVQTAIVGIDEAVTARFFGRVD